MVQGFPHREALFFSRVPIRRVISPLEQSHHSPRSMKNTRLLHTLYTCALSAGERVGVAELAVAPAILLKPVEAELRIVVEVIFGEESVNELKCCSHAHRCAIGLKHGR